jgi:hypothetical protein
MGKELCSLKIGKGFVILIWREGRRQSIEAKGMQTLIHLFLKESIQRISRMRASLKPPSIDVVV